MLSHYLVNNLPGLQNLAEVPMAPIAPEQLAQESVKSGLELDSLSQRIGSQMNKKDCGKWCKEVSQHLKNLYKTRKQKI